MARIAFIAHQPTKDGDVETIRLTVMRSLNLNDKVDIAWTRGPKTDWGNPTVVPVSLEDSFAAASALSTLKTFMNGAEVDGSDPDALIVALERDGSELFVRNATGGILKAADVVKHSTMDEYLTDVAGTKKRYSARAADEDDARVSIGRLILKKAEEDPSCYDDLAVWGKAGKPVKRVEKKDGIKLPDLGAYCKRGHQRSAQALKLKRSGKKPAEAAAE